MTRRVPPPLRTWSGALLVCALMLCLSGLARPALAMEMPAPMKSASSTTSGGAASGGRMLTETAGHPAQLMMTYSAGHGPHCPMIQQQCETPQATVVPDGPVATALGESPRAVACSPAALVSQANAPPPPVPPPDLHRLCVSRT
ncbi:hypothetical protein [Streptomyces sp. KR80]|uniref:hypothetical protein n=1 Tax=Streptomyces sp. KR80 TaxID=3457426 RepID=UPI003FD34FED